MQFSTNSRSIWLKALRTADNSAALRADLPDAAVDEARPMKLRAYDRPLDQAACASAGNWLPNCSLMTLEKMRTVS